MRVLIATTFVLACVSLPALGTATGAGGETPTAADLLRAEQRAREAAERLRVPPRPVRRWKRGGDGWLRGVEAAEPAAAPAAPAPATHAAP